MRGRTSLVHYRHMGIADCIADSADSYVDIALRLGTDPAWRGGIVDRIHARSHVLFDDRRAAAAFARLLLEAAGRTKPNGHRWIGRRSGRERGGRDGEKPGGGE